MRTAAVIALAALGLGLPARADLQIEQKTVINCPGLQQLFREIPADQRAPLLRTLSPMLTGTPWRTTTYLQGRRLRTDMGQTSVLADAASGRAVTLDRRAHRYSPEAYDPFQSAAGQFTCRITPTRTTDTLLGRTVRRYTLTMTSSVLPHSAITGELWAAPGLPTPPTPHYTGAAADFGAEMAKVQGMPLAYTLVYHDTPVGDITVTSGATAIKDAPLSSDVFRIPSDFQRGAVRSATALPSTGFPLGDGMPLDSLNAVTDAMATGQAAGGTTTADTSGSLSRLLQQLQGSGSPLGDASPSGGLGGGLSGDALSGLLQQLTGGSGLPGGGDLGSLLNPQMLQQLLAQLQSLEDDE